MYLKGRKKKGKKKMKKRNTKSLVWIYIGRTGEERCGWQEKEDGENVLKR